jgi:CPA1 family monovalent cation:H+ antiporter
MALIQVALVLLLITVVGGAFARWTPIGLPIFLVFVGAAASLIPGLDALTLDPEIFLLLFIPPLLFADARGLPRRDLLQVLKPVLLLAIGLVVLTVVTVGYFIHWLVPAMPLAVAFTLGAIVSPTDAVATVATTTGLSLPHRVANTVNAESLLNDATGLVAFKLAVAAAVAASTVSGSDVLVNFLLLSGGGVAVGLVVEWLGRKLREALISWGVDDPVVQALLEVLIPYAAYLAAEALHVSGVLAVVLAGLFAGGRELQGLSAEGRRHAREVWRMVSWVFNGLVFVLLGLQLRHMLHAVEHFPAWWLAALALALWGLLTVLRVSWVWASAKVRFRLLWGWAGSNAGPDWKRMLLVSWAAVRGSITLATALSVPLLTAAGEPFPQRELVVFLAGATIVLTLLLNGIPLPWLIRRLHPRSEAEGLPEENAARVAIARAGIAALQPVLAGLSDGEDRTFVQGLIRRYEDKIALRESAPEAASGKAARIVRARGLRLQGIAAERECLHRLHAEARINDETMRVIEEELDEREMLNLAEPMRG